MAHYPDHGCSCWRAAPCHFCVNGGMYDHKGRSYYPSPIMVYQHNGSWSYEHRECDHTSHGYSSTNDAANAGVNHLSTCNATRYHLTKNT